MEHDFSVHGSYMVAAIQMFLGMTILFQGILRKNNLLRKVTMSLAPYFYSFSPVMLLVYLLYIVSYRLI